MQVRRVLKINLGLNLGNQDTKIKATKENDRKEDNRSLFSSLATYDYKGGMDKNDYLSDPNKILINDKTCLIGIGNPSFGDFKFRDEDELKTLACYAVIKSIINRKDKDIYGVIEVDMCVGLPIKEYKIKENHEKINKIFNDSVDIKYLNLEYTIRFTKTIIAPEGYAYYAAFKEEKGYDKYRKILLLDFGSRTIDTVDIVNGTAVKPDSIPEMGTISLMDKIRETGISLDNVELDIMLKEGLYELGNTIYRKEDFKSEIDRYARLSHQLITQKYGDLKSFQKIIIIGGGSYLVGDIFKKYYPELVEVVEKAEFAIADAYYELSFLKC